MADQDVTRHSARQLADVVRAGAVTAEQVAQAHLERVVRLRSLGAFQSVDREAVLRDARAVDADPARRAGPLAGVPVAVKDSFDVAGYPTRLGSAATPDRPAVSDDELVRRLRAAGAFVIGKSAMPELAIWPFTESAAFGVARNPWNPERTAGGSTGGGAVAVAARMATLALGSDGGGSLRIPAACCGIVGYKPTPGLVPLAGGAQAQWLGLSASGPLARSVDDAALMLDVLAGREPRAPLARPSAPPRIAVSTAPLLVGGRVDPQVAAVTWDAARALSGAGATIVHTAPPYPLDISVRFIRRWLAGISEEAEGLDASRLEPRTRDLARAGRVVRRLGLATHVDREPLTGRMEAWFRGHDLFLTPTLAAPPVVHGRWSGGWFRTVLGVGSWIMTPPWNLFGFPAISVPVGFSKDRLPLGVQLSAPPGREELILSTAQLLTELMPFPAWAEA